MKIAVTDAHGATTVTDAVEVLWDCGQELLFETEAAWEPTWYDVEHALPAVDTPPRYYGVRDSGSRRDDPSLGLAARAKHAFLYGAIVAATPPIRLISSAALAEELSRRLNVRSWC